MKIEKGRLHGKEVFFIRTAAGVLFFDTLDEAEAFLEDFFAKCPDYSLLDLQTLQEDKKDWLSIALTLAFIAVAIKAQDDLERLQLAGIEMLRDLFLKRSPPEWIELAQETLAQKTLAEKKKTSSHGYRP